MDPMAIIALIKIVIQAVAGPLSSVYKVIDIVVDLLVKLIKILFHELDLLMMLLDRWVEKKTGQQVPHHIPEKLAIA